VNANNQPKLRPIDRLPFRGIEVERTSFARIIVFIYLVFWATLVVCLIVFGHIMSWWLLYPIAVLVTIFCPDNGSIKFIFGRNEGKGVKLR
jgi:hypothetical protein